MRKTKGLDGGWQGLPTPRDSKPHGSEKSVLLLHRFDSQLLLIVKSVSFGFVFPPLLNIKLPKVNNHPGHMTISQPKVILSRAMISSHLISSPLLLTLASSFLFLLQLYPSKGNSLITCNFHKIYQLGDSISDTGNLIRQKPIGASTVYARLPYGETFFKHPTGRCSNGRLMIDFIAQASGLPFLSPYKKKDANFKQGVNFAVAGATALTKEVLAKANIADPYTNSSLKVQLDWMSRYFSTCIIERDCLEKLKNSLFIIGEIGGDDYNYAFVEGKTIEDVKSMIPKIVGAIITAVKRVISYGAVQVLVPGNFPKGCSPLYLTAFRTSDPTAYDEHHCLKDLNSVSDYHNNQLQEGIQELKREYPNVVIVYGDYNQAFEWLLDNAQNLGFDSKSTLKACCGTGGNYNYNLTRTCGAPGVPVCQHPEKFISWDGVHLTDEANKRMAGWLIDDILPNLKCSI